MAAEVGFAQGGKRAGAGRKGDADAAKRKILKGLRNGTTLADALRSAQRTRATYDYYMRSDSIFKAQVAECKAAADRGEAVESKEVPDFPEFCEQYMGQKLFPHQLQWFDLLEGHEPRDLHPAQEYTPGKQSRIIVNTPPGHAKSTTVTVNYAVWRIIKNPSIKIVIASKAAKLAEQFLLQIKERLTNSQYQKLIDDFAPPGGFEGDSAGWSATRFYLSSKVRGAEAKDPTVQAIGLRGQVYGSRADLIILDDCIDNTNVMDYDKQIAWLLGIVGSRLAPRSGRLLVIGTRIAATDMYVELQDPKRYYSQESPWTYLKQPAVLEYAEDPQEWVTLWPYSDSPADPDEYPLDSGLYRRWDGPTLADIRGGLPPAEWARLYQQEQVTEDGYFTPEMVAACTRGSGPGTIPNSGTGREGGMEGLRLIAGLDPAMSGFTAAVLVGLDMRTGKRWVVDVHNQAAMKPDEIRTLIRAWTEKYQVHEWRIEKNAFQAFLTQDREVRDYLAARGVVLQPHLTGSNKNDPQFGIAAMSMLFDQAMISLPQPRTEAVKAMREQLITWDPNVMQSKHALKGHKTDLVMALWMAELRCLEVYQSQQGSTHLYSPFHTRRDRARQYVVNGEELERMAMGV